MKHIIRYSMAVLPLLSLLAMSPSDIQVKTQSNYRSIASALPEGKTFEKELPKLGHRPIPKHMLEGGPKEVKPEDKKEDKPVVAEEKKDEVKPEDKKEDKPVVAEEKKEDKKPEDVKPEDKKEEKPVVADCEEKKPEDKKEDKTIEHPLIKQALEEGEKAAVAACKPKEEKKPEEKKEENKKEEQIVVKDEKKPEDKKEEKKEVCEQDEKVQALTKQVEQLLADQRQIMLTMMSMTQGMMTMIQNQQNQNPWAPYMNSMGMQSPYQYQSPVTAGNWVYYPQGFQPNQINIFAQPQMQAQQPMMQQQGGIFPDQMHMQQSSWGLQPQQYNFGQAQPMQPQQAMMPQQMQAQPMQPVQGTFGATNGAMGFNMSPSTPVSSIF